MMNSDPCLALIAYEKVSVSNELSDKDIRSLVKNETDLPVRRLDTFTLLSLLAVYRLFNNSSELYKKSSKPLSLYSAAEYLSVELFQSVITSMKNNESIRPFDFIATVGNAANFYIAKEFNIKGPNVFIGASEQPFMKSCALAEMDFLEGHSSQGIVIVWSITESSRQCYAFIIEKCETGIIGKIDNEEDYLNIDELIKKNLSIPIPAHIQRLF
ncbi:hypothetical protein ACM9HF_06665 [Colwellia sp. RE-S-Sl-9]